MMEHTETLADILDGDGWEHSADGLRSHWEPPDCPVAYIVVERIEETPNVYVQAWGRLTPDDLDALDEMVARICAAIAWDGWGRQ